MSAEPDYLPDAESHWHAEIQAAVKAFYRGDLVRAEKQLRNVLAETEEAGAYGPARSTCLANLAGVYMARGRFHEAEPFFRRALALAEELSLPPADLAVTLSNLGRCLQQLGRYEEAEPLYRRALTLHDQPAAPKTPTAPSTS
jgi:tetratricopeptide (TPR) repeat protein